MVFPLVALVVNELPPHDGDPLTNHSYDKLPTAPATVAFMVMEEVLEQTNPGPETLAVYDALPVTEKLAVLDWADDEGVVHARLLNILTYAV